MDYPTYIVSPATIPVILQDTPCYLVWDNEGTGTAADRKTSKGENTTTVTGWEFNDEHKRGSKMDVDFEALLLDAYTASAITKVLAALKPDLQAAIPARISRDRAYFGQFIEKVWACVG